MILPLFLQRHWKFLFSFHLVLVHLNLLLPTIQWRPTLIHVHACKTANSSSTHVVWVLILSSTHVVWVLILSSTHVVWVLVLSSTHSSSVLPWNRRSSVKSVISVRLLKDASLVLLVATLIVTYVEVCKCSISQALIELFVWLSFPDNWTFWSRCTTVPNSLFLRLLLHCEVFNWSDCVNEFFEIELCIGI